MLSPALSCLVMSIQTMRDLLGHSPTSPDLAAFQKGLRSPAYSPYPVTPITLAVTPETKEGTPRPSTLSITRNMTGKEFVTALGEPDRKGGGSGPSSGNIGIWVEWTRDGLMVEFGGDDSRGPQAWERGKDAPWRVISIFSSKVK